MMAIFDAHKHEDNKPFDFYVKFIKIAGVSTKIASRALIFTNQIFLEVSHNPEVSCNWKLNLKPFG